FRHISGLKPPGEGGMTIEDAVDTFHKEINRAAEYLAEFEGQRDESLLRGRSFDDETAAEHANGLIKDLHDKLHQLDEALNEFVKKPKVLAEGKSDELSKDKGIQKALESVLSTADQLHKTSYHDFWSGLAQARLDQRRSFLIVLATGLGGMLLTAGMLRGF